MPSPQSSQSHISQTTHPVPTTSPSQSVPGRRTPLGTVGIGGFYAQSSLAHSHHHTDENLPGGSSEKYVKFIGISTEINHLLLNRKF